MRKSQQKKITKNDNDNLSYRHVQRFKDETNDVKKKKKSITLIKCIFYRSISKSTAFGAGVVKKIMLCFIVFICHYMSAEQPRCRLPVGI